MSRHHIPWTVAPAYAAQFTPAVLDDIVSGRIIAREEVKRELAGRRVSRLCLSLPGLPEVYLKTYTIPLTKIFRALLRPYGFNEWRVARALGQLGIPTFAAIAIGAVRRFGLYRQVYFITEAIPDSMTLKEYIDRYGPQGKDNIFHPGQDLIDHFAAFAATLRKAGILHRDFHWGNILIRTSAAGPPQFYLIDLHQVRIKTALSDREGLSNLALLNAALWGNVPSRSQINFLKAYCKNLLLRRDSFVQARDAVKQQSTGLLRRKWKKHSARCRRENKYFKKIRCGRCSGYARRDCPDRVLRLMEQPDRLFFSPEALLLKDSRTTASLVVSAGEPAAAIYVKRYNRKGWWAVVKRMVAGSRAQKVWQAAHAMTARDIPTPQPLLYLEERRFGLVGKSFFVTRAVAPAMTLDSFVAGDFAGLGRIEKNSLIRTIARELRMMHDRGIRHGDLKAKNILLADAPSEDQKIFLVDLDAVRVKRRLSLKDRSRDLARLNCSFLDTSRISTAHRLAFLKIYLGAVKRGDLRAMWGATLRLTEKKLKKSNRVFT